MKKILLLTLLLLSFCAVAHSQGAVFKVPDGVMPIDWNKNGFKGILMLCKDSPSGMFIGYPNDGETIEAMRERVAKFVAPMFVHDEKDKTDVEFKKTPIAKHDGDFGESGLYYSFENDKSAVQILFYEREGTGKNFLYGYFSTKDKTGKYDRPKIWADEKGQGVKVFDKFWKSFK